MKAKPQLDEAIAYLEAEIAALCAGEKDERLVDIAVSVVAGEPPLLKPQFAPLLALWTPAPSSIVSDLATLVNQFEAAKQREEEKKAHRKDDQGIEITGRSALDRVRGKRRRPRTRPRRRFEDPGEDDASQSASDETNTSSPREDAVASATALKKEMTVENGAKEEERDKADEKKDVEMEENTETMVRKKDVEAEKKKDKEVEAEKKKDKEVEAEKKKDEVVEEEKKEDKVVEADIKKEKSLKKQEEAAIALASLKALRKMMLLDVLSKIVSVAKSKDVDPAMFTKEEGNDTIIKEEGKELVDLKKIQDRVIDGVICEWAQFAAQVYLFCQHVVTDAEQHEQSEARRKGVELLHFARTLTETLRKASVKKETALLEKIREVEEEDETGKDETETACNEKAMQNDTMKKCSAAKNNDHAVKITAYDSHDLSNKTAKGKSLDTEALSPSRASTRIRKRTSVVDDDTASVAPSPSSRTSQKRTRVASVSIGFTGEKVSGSESHDASASEADTKLREQGKSAKSPTKHTPARRRRPSLPATRISSRQQKRRVAAAAAAAAAADNAGKGDEEEHSSHETLQVAEEKEGGDLNEKGNDEEEKTEKKEQEEEEPVLKKKKATPKSRNRKKGSRK